MSIPGPWEWILIILAILILFGASAIPKFARSIGKAKSEFEKGVKEGKEPPKEEDEKPKKK